MSDQAHPRRGSVESTTALWLSGWLSGLSQDEQRRRRSERWLRHSGVPRRSVTLVRGTTSRRKLIEIDVGQKDDARVDTALRRLRRGTGA